MVGKKAGSGCFFCTFVKKSMVLITGCTGLVGSATARELLKNGYPVRALARPNSDRSLVKDIESQINWVEGDILDVASIEAALVGVSHVIHAAAIVSFAPSQRKMMFKTNVEGTANVVNACLRTNIKKLCFVSSIAALGRPDLSRLQAEKRSEAIVIDENQKWEQSSLNSNYAKSKRLAELEVWRGVAEGLSAVVVNPSVVLGEGNWRFSSAQLFKYVFDQKPFYTQGTVNVVDALDVARAVRLLLFSSIEGERFILSAGALTYQALFGKIADGFEKNPPTIKVTNLMAQIVWRFEAVRSWLTGKAPLITRETAKTARTNFVMDSTKIKRELGFEFGQIDQSISRICKYFAATV